MERSSGSFNKQSLDFAYGVLHLLVIVKLENVYNSDLLATYPELLVGLDKKVELGRAVWRRLLSRLVVDS